MQTSISQDPPIAARGALGDEGPRRISSMPAAWPVDFGGGCFRLPSDAPRTCRGSAAPTSAIAFEGVAFYDTSRQRAEPLDGPDYAATETVPVIVIGRVWVWVEGAVTEASEVHARFAVGADPALNKAGNFTTAADGTNTQEVANGAKWLTRTTAAGLALLDLNLP